MSFHFNKENLKKSKEIISKYPKERLKSAIMPLLDLSQRQNNNYISKDIIEYLSELLELPVIHIYEVASFYSMYNLEPTGKYLIQICGTTPCMLRGSKNITKSIKKHLKIDINETTKDKIFTLKEVECLGACVNAPIIQVNDDYYEDLDENKVIKILKELKNIT
jgi:NADH-quinone oxidoreductase E subunit